MKIERNSSVSWEPEWGSEDVWSMQLTLYSIYQLYWMIVHGFGLSDLVEMLARVQDERATDVAVEEGTDIMDIVRAVKIDPVYKDFEENLGFEDEVNGGGQIYASRNEFLQNEYLDESYVKTLCSLVSNGDELLDIYRFDRASAQEKAA